MTDSEFWQVGADRVLSRETGDFRLVVQAVGDHARFLVLRHPRHAGRYPQAIFASGTESDVRTAMEAAERMAARLAAAPRGRAERPQMSGGH